MKLYDLVLSYEGFDAFEGKNLHYQFIDRATMVATLSGEQAIASGKAELPAFIDALPSGGNFYFDAWLDTDADGICGGPPEEPGFRLNFDNIIANHKISPSFHRGFVDICPLVEQEAISGVSVAISGQVTAAKGIVEAGEIEAEKAIPNAVITLVDYPLFSTLSDEEGNFSLNAILPAVPSTLRVYAYYAFYGEPSEAVLLLPSSAKYGTAKELSFDGATISLAAGSLALEHTRSINITMQDSAKERLGGCWLSIPTLGHHINITESETESGMYQINEIASGNYILHATCPGKELQTFSYEALKASDFAIFDSATLTIK